MCKDCGCIEGNEKAYFNDKKNKHDHDHDHKHHEHAHDHESKTINLEISVLQKNDDLAHDNWHWLDDHGVMTINLMSSPGTGKTYLLEKTLQALRNEMNITVLVGDQQTNNDAERLMGKGGNVKQINTLSSCHLDASMIAKELNSFVDGKEDLLIIENVGNLVCPAAFKLGEKIRVALLSTTEGEDKPIKYPVLFNSADLIIITKTDLIPHLEWSKDKALQYVKQINPKAQIIFLSAKNGEGMQEWLDYLKQFKRTK